MRTGDCFILRSKVESWFYVVMTVESTGTVECLRFDTDGGVSSDVRFTPYRFDSVETLGCEIIWMRRTES